MNDLEMAAMKQELLRLRAELQALGDSLDQSSETVELDQARVGRLTRMDAMQAQQMALEAARRRQQRLVAIAGALRRIDAGEYGHCFVCGQAIDLRRLSVDPTSTRCMKCLEK